MFPIHHILQRPPTRTDGQAVYELRLADVVRKTEPALIAQFICDRGLFGHVYGRLMSDHFASMTADSGVFIFPLVITQAIIPTAIRPGDIDILVIPYHRDKLILDHILAIEVKVIRASFLKQGKSPNEYGFSQAALLLELGFPYAAVVHLITSDKSPRQAWEETCFTTVLNNAGKLAIPRKIKTDLLPSNLVQRAYGRLLKNSTHPEIGFAAAYLVDVFEKKEIRNLCMPFGQDAVKNSLRKSQTEQATAEYFHKHALQAFDNPRGDSSLLF